MTTLMTHWGDNEATYRMGQMGKGWSLRAKSQIKLAFGDGGQGTAQQKVSTDDNGRGCVGGGQSGYQTIKAKATSLSGGVYVLCGGYERQ